MQAFGPSVAKTEKRGAPERLCFVPANPTYPLPTSRLAANSTTVCILQLYGTSSSMDITTIVVYYE